MKEGRKMAGAVKKSNHYGKEKKKDGTPTPISGNVPISEDIKKTAKALKRKALKVGILTEEESLALASQMALGLSNDRFGLEMSAADRIKALSIVTTYHANSQGVGSKESLEAGDKLVVSVRKLAKETGK